MIYTLLTQIEVGLLETLVLVVLLLLQPMEELLGLFRHIQMQEFLKMLILFLQTTVGFLHLMEVFGNIPHVHLQQAP